MTQNLYDVFRRKFPADRTQPFIETPEGDVYSYADLDGTSGCYARLLSDMGVGPGDRVAVQVEKSPQAIFLYLACLRVGAVYVPLNMAYPVAEVDYFLSDAEPAVMVCDPAREAEITRTATANGVRHVLTLDPSGAGSLVDSLVEEAGSAEPDFPDAERGPDSLAALLYTSGTTGRSKGAMLTHGNLGSNAQALHAAWGWVPGDVLLHALPIFHTHGLFVAIHCVLLSGASMLFMPRFDAETVIRLLPRASVFMGVPTFYTRLLEHDGLTAETCGGIRLFISGSAPLLEDTFRAFEARTGQTILERYGMTETGMNTSNPLDGERIAGTVGKPLEGVEARVVDTNGTPLADGQIGVLEVRGPNVFKGYWRMPEKTASEFRPDGFFITGDLARIGDNGYISIVGRDKDLIITGGYNVYPKEVEILIDSMDGVVESAVIGLPDADFGESVTAVVKRAKGREDLTAKTIIKDLKARIAGYKVPKRVFFADFLPRNAMGKVQKNELRARYGD